MFAGAMKIPPFESSAALGSEDAGLLLFDPSTQEFETFLPGIAADYVSYAPDGKRILFVTFPGTELWTASADGKNLSRISIDGESAYAAQWSPAGDRITYMSWIDPGPWRVMVVNADGGERREVLLAPYTGADPTWSPDGKAILFAPYPWDVSEALQAIYRASIENQSAQRLAGSEQHFSPRWSPDGRYVAALTGENSSLRILDTTSGEWTTLVQDSSYYPSWSNDSKGIYFIDPHDGGTIRRVELADKTVRGVLRIDDLDLVGNSPFQTNTSQWFGVAPNDALILLVRKK
jgi:Tol biopolymer transport system component